MPTVKTIATEVSVILGLLNENWTTIRYDELPEELKKTLKSRRNVILTAYCDSDSKGGVS